MAEGLQGQVVVVTGASAGIGAACALALGREGARLVLTARREERLRAMAAKLTEAGAEAIWVAGDAREEETGRRTVERALAAFGRIDVLINNAGVAVYKPLVETSVEEYDRMMDSNFRSTFLFTRYAVPHMIQARSGLVLIVSSVAGIYGFPRESVYCASKFAQVGFAQALDHELRPHNVKVCTICPGGVKTELAIGTGRTEEGVRTSGMLEPDDVAQAVLLACTQPEGSRIIQIQMRPMVEPLT